MSYDGKVVYKFLGDTSDIETALKRVGVSIGAAMVAAGGAAIKFGSDFEKGMSQVAATMGFTAAELADESSEAAKTFAMLENAALEAGETTKYSATEASEALNYLALAGYSAEESIAVLPKMLNAASAAGVDLAYMSDLVTDGLSATGKGIDELDTYLDQMTRTSQRSNTNMAQLGEATLTVGGTMKALKGGVTEMNTVLGVLADNGIKGSEGGTALRNVILALSAPTDKAAKTLKSLGVDAFDASGNLRSIPDVMDDLNAAMSSMTEGQKTGVLNEIFNKVDLKSVNALLATSSERWADLTDEITNSAGATKAAAETQEANLQGMITIVKSQLEGLAISLYKGMEEPLKSAVGLFSEFLTSLKDTGIVEEMAGAIGELGNLLASVLVEILPVLIDLITGVGTPLIDLASTVLPPVIQLFQMLLEPLIEMIEMVMPVLISALQTVIPPFMELAQAVLPLLVGIFIALLEPLVELIEKILPYLAEYMDLVAEVWTRFAEAVLPIVLDMLDKIIPVMLRIADAILPVLIDLFTQLIPPLFELAENLLPILLALFDALIVPLLDLVETLLPIFIELFDKIIPVIVKLVEAFTPLLELLAGLVIIIADALMPVIEFLAELLTGVLGEAIGGLMPIIGDFLDILSGLITFITGVFSGDWEKAWDGIVQMFTGIFNLIPSTIERVINGAIELLNGLIKGVNKITGKLGIKEINLIDKVQLPRLAVGMDYVPMDDFPALLHQGEMVLNARDAAAYRAEQAAVTPVSSQRTNSMNIGSLTINPNAQQWAEVMDLLHDANTAEQQERAGYYDGN